MVNIPTLAKNKAMGKYKWQGNDVKVKFGSCLVTPNEEKPLFWYNYECYTSGSVKNIAVIPAIMVTTEDGYTFCMANHYGIGAYKLKKGGWQNCQHFSLPDDSFSEDAPGDVSYRELDEELFSSHEAERRKWQMKNYPDEFNSIERLRKLAISHNQTKI